MPNKMLIDATHPEETRVVVVRGNRVEEFDFETAQRKQLRGNIYLAKVTRVEPSLQAAFIEYGGNRHGFLAFSEIHPDYYQIPVADRQALIEADERAHREAEEETENRSSRRKPRHRNSRRRSGGERVQSAVVEVDPGLAPQPYDGDVGDHTPDQVPAEAPASDTSAGDGHENPAAQQTTNAGDHDHPTSDDAGVAARPNDEPTPPAELADGTTTSAPAAGSSDDRAQPMQTLHADDGTAPVESASAEAEPAHHDHAHHDHTHHDHADHSHDADAEHQDLVAAHHDDSEHAAHHDESHADDAHDSNADDDEEEDDDEDAEEDVVESVGGEDVLEEVPERSFRPRRQYKIQEVIKRRQVMLVQVVKEERGNKGAALTTYLSLAGRYAVLMPNTARGGGISRKITSAQDRSRLKEVVQDLDVPEGMGIILRTAGASRTKPEIKRDFEYLIRMWETVRDMTLKSQAPTLVYEEGSLIKRSLRDLYNKEIDEIQVAGDAGYREAHDFMKMLMPTNVRAVKLYRDGQPLFSRMGVESQLDAMFSPTVQLKSGGYIVINQTEALVSIDVNSGRSTREHHIEDTALKTNLEAAEEVARQLRLRDLAGLIVIDFIDMDEKRNNRSVERKMSDCLRQDRARIQVGRISHFGLLEMSRQRIRASVLESSTEPCPQCGGSGHVRSVSSVALQLLRGLEEILMKGATHNLTVRTRADVALYVLNHKRGHLRDLETSFMVTLAVIADPSVTAQQSFIIDRGEQIHTLDAAKANLAAQVAAFPPPHEEVYDEDDEAFEVEAEVETEETVGLVDDGLVEEVAAPEGSESETDADGRKRKRRRRRRGRGEGREGAPNGRNEDGEAPPAVAVDGEHSAEESDAEGDGDDQPSEALSEGAVAEGAAGDERRPRRRGRRGGRRRRNGTEDGLVGSISDELGPRDESDAAPAVADLEGHATEQPNPVEPDTQPWDDPRRDAAREQDAFQGERASSEAMHETTPPVTAPAPDPVSAPAAQADSAQEQDKSARRRSTVREKVSFLSDPALDQTAAAPADTPPAEPKPDPVAIPEAATPPVEAAAEPTAPRKAGWWRRFGGGE
ncbi:MAG: ribonuclease [Tardiphaga sp.]|nr:ribonuclease [Tardiphaga sp.]